MLGRLDPSVTAAWTLVVVVTAVVGVAQARRERRRSRRLWGALAVLVSSSAWATTLVVFQVVGTSPVVQMNDEAGRHAFSLWVVAWPLFLLGSLVGTIAGTTLAVTDPAPPRGSLAWLAVAAACLFTGGAVLANFPSA